MKVALITGGARGIGAATGAELARRGWTTVLADIDASGDVVELDVTDAAACERCELRDPRPHRAGPDDADGRGDRPRRL